MTQCTFRPARVDDLPRLPPGQSRYESTEIGLNAVHPARCGQGVGTELYELAVERMRQAGMRVATVSTGGDPSHAPARSAYRKAGFAVEIPQRLDVSRALASC